MALELTSTSRRTPLHETTFVTKVPPYVQTYLGEPQVRLRRRHLRMNRLGETTFVKRVPPYIQTYLGQHEYDARGRALAQHDYGARGEREREMMGFGALDSRVSTADLQRLLRRAGYCDAGVVDNLWGPNTQSALERYMAEGVRRTPGGDQIYTSSDYSASRRASSVQIDSGLLAKLRNSAAGMTDDCPMQPIRTSQRTAPPPPEEEPYYEAQTASVFSNPLLWLGIAAAVGVGYYAYTQRGSDDMMMNPPRL